jgi:hypothetical protein
MRLRRECLQPFSLDLAVWQTLPWYRRLARWIRLLGAAY